MANQEVKLLGFWVSPFVRRVEWALKLKGIEYEYIEEDIFNKSPLLLKLNPVHQKVPVLVFDHHKVIAESYVILEFIDDTWTQNPLLPQDPYQRAKARFWAKFAEEKVFEAAWNALCSSGKDKKMALKLTIEAMERIEGESKGIENFFGGENIGYLDIAMGWMAHWLPVWEEVGSMQILDPNKFPATVAWINRFISHPMIKHNLPPRDKMITYFRKRSQELSSSVQGWIKI
ncbi:S-crystallin [Trema orientale]|uniref:Glutathione S-transferase n=1 Tax=Trema orientale TaxID=63057 RepID=A0A2P5FLK3_TREOI|nr:S-crystallin [Trema orientale]